MAAEWVQNGGFSSGNFTDWTVTVGQYDHLFTGLSNDPSNQHLAGISTNGSPSTRSQVLNTVAGKSYTVTFGWSTQYATSGSPFEVSLGGDVLFSYTAPSSGSTGWVT
jgi:hypothetical protein